MLHIAVAQFKPVKGEYAANVRRFGGLVRTLAEQPDPPDLLVLPEAAMAGYLLEGGVREVAVTAGTLFDDLQAQHQVAGGPPLDVVVGFYERWRDRLYNSALYATLGGGAPGIVHVHRKVFLPTYGVLDEERFVEAGHDVRVFDARWGKVALLICEDAWHSLPPTVAALRGAQVVIVPSASPARGIAPGEETVARPGNVARWERIARGVAEEHGVWVVVPQLVGFEGGKGFAGGRSWRRPGARSRRAAPCGRRRCWTCVWTWARSPGRAPTSRSWRTSRRTFRTSSRRCRRHPRRASTTGRQAGRGRRAGPRDRRRRSWPPGGPAAIRWRLTAPSPSSGWSRSCGKK